MNGTLRTALLIVAVVSIAIALHYPVAQYLDGKTLDDEMLALRRIKAEAAAGAGAEPHPGRTDRDITFTGSHKAFYTASFFNALKGRLVIESNRTIWTPLRPTHPAGDAAAESIRGSVINGR